MLMNMKEDKWETDILERDFVHTKFICENPLSASALLTGTISINPFRSLSSTSEGMFRGSSLKNSYSRYDVIMPVTSMLNISSLSHGIFSPLGHFSGQRDSIWFNNIFSDESIILLWRLSIKPCRNCFRLNDLYIQSKTEMTLTPCL
jgi:hypothetical protein